MEIKYTAPVMIRLRVAEALKEHADKLCKQLTDEDISLIEFHRRSFPINAIGVIDAAISKSIEKDSVDATLIDPRKLLKVMSNDGS